jgi:hypothetical protein
VRKVSSGGFLAQCSASGNGPFRRDLAHLNDFLLAIGGFSINLLAAAPHHNEQLFL